MDNFFSLSFAALSVNESFARTVTAAFTANLNPTVAEIMEIKTAVSEAVTNAVIHGYENRGAEKSVRLNCRVSGRTLYIEVADDGVGIEDVARAMEPMFTSKPEQERSGLGFAVMEGFMDSVNVKSELGKGTVVEMMKRLND